MLRKKLLNIMIAPIVITPVISSVSCSNVDDIKALMQTLKNQITSAEFFGSEGTEYNAKISYTKWDALDSSANALLTKENLYWSLGISKNFELSTSRDVWALYSFESSFEPDQLNFVVYVIGRTNNKKQPRISDKVVYKLNKPSAEEALKAANQDIDDLIESAIGVTGLIGQGPTFNVESSSYNELPNQFSKNMEYDGINQDQWEALLSLIVGKDCTGTTYRLGDWKLWEAEWVKDTVAQSGTLTIRFISLPAPKRGINIIVTPRGV